MITNTPYAVKAGVSPEDLNLFNVTWITEDELILIAVGSRGNKVLVGDTVVPDTRQFEVYRSIKGHTVAVIRYAEGLVATYKNIRTREQLKKFLGDNQQAQEIYRDLGWEGAPLRQSMMIPLTAIPPIHRSYTYRETKSEHSLPVM